MSEVVIGEAGVFKRIMEIGCSEDGFNLRIIHIKQRDETCRKSGRQLEVELVGEIPIIFLVYFSVAVCCRFPKHLDMGRMRKQIYHVCLL